MTHLPRGGLEETMDNISADLLTIFWWGVAALGLTLITAGSANKVVIYYDRHDMVISFLGVLLPMVALQMWTAQPFESAVGNWFFQWLAAPAVGLSGLLCIVVTFAAAITHNRSVVLGVAIGVFKIVFVCLTVLVVLAQLGQFTDRKSAAKDVMVAALCLALFVSIAKALVNGPAVYRARGWALPEPHARPA
jgi:hypothetical protein